MKRWVRIVLIVVLAAGLVVGLFGMLRRQTEDRKGAESYAEAAAIAGEFVRDAMVSTRNQPDFEERGVSFELNLGAMTALLH